MQFGDNRSEKRWIRFACENITLGVSSTQRQREADKHLHTIYKMALNGNLVIASNTPNHNSIFKLLTFFLFMGYLTQLGRIEVQQTGQNNYLFLFFIKTFPIKYNYTNKILN